jgi:alpha,alpha-trehalase
LWGLYTLGFDWEPNDYSAFIADLAERDGGNLQIVYGIDGTADLTERVLDHPQGYQGARPVRIGNAAYKQQPNDVWGTVLESVYLHTKSRDRLDERVWEVARQQVEHALEHWREPDRGIWEIRGEPRHFTSSKVMCWVAADRGARLARLRDEPDTARLWQKAADEIHADICANAHTTTAQPAHQPNGPPVPDFWPRGPSRHPCHGRAGGSAVMTADHGVAPVHAGKPLACCRFRA